MGPAWCGKTACATGAHLGSIYTLGDPCNRRATSGRPPPERKYKKYRDVCRTILGELRVLWGLWFSGRLPVVTFSEANSPARRVQMDATATLYEAEPLPLAPNRARSACCSPVTKLRLSTVRISRFTCGDAQERGLCSAPGDLEICQRIRLQQCSPGKRQSTSASGDLFKVHVLPHNSLPSTGSGLHVQVSQRLGVQEGDRTPCTACLMLTTLLRFSVRNGGIHGAWV